MAPTIATVGVYLARAEADKRRLILGVLAFREIASEFGERDTANASIAASVPAWRIVQHDTEQLHAQVRALEHEDVHTLAVVFTDLADIMIARLRCAPAMVPAAALVQEVVDAVNARYGAPKGEG